MWEWNKFSECSLFWYKIKIVHYHIAFPNILGQICVQKSHKNSYFSWWWSTVCIWDTNTLHIFMFHTIFQVYKLKYIYILHISQLPTYRWEPVFVCSEYLPLTVARKDTRILQSLRQVLWNIVVEEKSLLTFAILFVYIQKLFVYIRGHLYLL